jgi:hypothetical protein
MEFIIAQSSTTFKNRPPISSKVRGYFEQFITKQLLKPKNIIVGSQWQIELVICFVEEGPRYKSGNLFLAKQPRTISSEKIKIYEILVPLKLLSGVDQPYLRTIELIYEALTLFFTTIYKSVTPQEMKMLWQNVDLDRLNTLPYPAALPDQKYVGDLVDKNGRVFDALEQWRTG